MLAGWLRNGALSRMMLALLALAWGSGLRPAVADDQPPAPPMATPLNEEAPLNGLPLQPADDPPARFEPRQPRSDADQQRLASLAWYMTGQLHQSRQEFDEAVAAFRQAVKIDPAAIDAYRTLIPLLYTRADDDEDREEARELALQAAGRTADGYDLVRGLAAVMARGGDVGEAAALLGKALELPSLQKGSLTELLLRRDVGLFYRLGGNGEKAAESYRLVFEALQKTDDEALSEEDREKLLGDPGTTYDEMGQVFLDAKLPDLAVKAFEEAARFRASRPAIHSYNLATVFRQTGQPEKALNELQKYFDAELQSKGRPPISCSRNCSTNSSGVTSCCRNSKSSPRKTRGTIHSSTSWQTNTWRTASSMKRKSSTPGRSAELRIPAVPSDLFRSTVVRTGRKICSTP